eukprot:TRINITY_DN9265_c1_g3_i1.p1 TRINITY_DN9265_c1_g3~~TRINITY_DN9265_c1_g3_i1.p1  ORF type:complete len:873 (-),score=215.60 TRINITY_DN9265_c1_g3_i1:56-2674(-)
MSTSMTRAESSDDDGGAAASAPVMSLRAPPASAAQERLSRAGSADSAQTLESGQSGSTVRFSGPLRQETSGLLGLPPKSRSWMEVSHTFRTVSSRFLELMPAAVKTRFWFYNPSLDAWTLGMGSPTSTSVGLLGDFVERAKTGDEDAWGFEAKSGAGFRRLLVVLAICSSLISFLVDSGVEAFDHVRICFVDAVAGLLPTTVGEAIFDVCLVCGARLAVAFGPQAAGSGLPEVKCILSGLPMQSLLGVRVLFAKFLGLLLAIGGRLPVGKEGPFVHVAACVSACLMDSGYFSQGRLPREEVFLAAVSVGVGATFSAPVGGVLFALELMMPRLYDTSSYAACFFASTMGTLCFLSLKNIYDGGQMQPLFNSDLLPTQQNDKTAHFAFIALCMVLGAVCGALGGLFVQCHRHAFAVVNRVRGIRPPPAPRRPNLSSPGPADQLPAGKASIPSFRSRADLSGSPAAAAPPPPRCGGASLSRDLAIMAFVAVAGCALRAATGSELMQLGQGPLLTKLFAREQQAPELGSASAVALLFLAKWLYTVIALSLPVPAGCVAPTLVLGALAGRCCAAALPAPVAMLLAPDGDFESLAAMLAIVGATTLCGSVCRVISVVVTVFELIALPSLILPLALATLIANYMGNRLGPSIFDSILMIKRVPAMPTLAASQQALRRIEDVMDPRLLEVALPRYATLEELERVVEAARELQDEGYHVPQILPVVEEMQEGGRMLCGAVALEHLQDVRRHAAKLKGRQAAAPSSSKSPVRRRSPARLSPSSPARGATSGEDSDALPAIEVNGRRLQAERSRKLSARRDILRVIVGRRLLANPLQVEPQKTLKQAYLRAQAVQYEGPFMIVEQGTLVGILTHAEIMELSNA